MFLNGLTFDLTKKHVTNYFADLYLYRSIHIMHESAEIVSFAIEYFKSYAFFKHFLNHINAEI